MRLTMAGVEHIQTIKCAVQMLDAIDSKRVEGIFCGDLRHVPEGQAHAMELLDDSYGAIGS